MTYAIIKFSGKQYRVTENEIIELEHLVGKTKDKLVFDEVLLASSGDKLLVGQPTVVKMKVEGEVLSHVRGEKVRVAKFRAKSRYRKVQGAKQPRTQVKITKIFFPK
jgi:large subunit ribosomal protein L21